MSSLSPLSHRFHAVHKIDGKRRYYWSFNKSSNVWEQKTVSAKEKSL